MQSAKRSLFFLLSVASINSYACPEGQYEQCVGPSVPQLGIHPACACLPNSGTVVDAAKRPFTETLAAAGGAALEAWINQSRNSAIGTSSPIPPQIRNALIGYIPERILDKARYKVGDNGILNLAGLSIHYGDPAAVTVNDLIVFRDGGDAQNNPALWAHELTHVRQYDDWGVGSFAVKYVRDYNDVESEAYRVGDNYEQWAFARPPSQTAETGRSTRVSRGNSIGNADMYSNQGEAIVLGFASGTALFACGCWGPGAAFVAEPRCQSGTAMAMNCAGMCPNGGLPYGYVCR